MPASPSSRAAASPAPAERPKIAIEAPLRPSASAIARPRPALPPVTTATRRSSGATGRSLGVERTDLAGGEQERALAPRHHEALRHRTVVAERGRGPDDRGDPGHEPVRVERAEAGAPGAEAWL